MLSISSDINEATRIILDKIADKDVSYNIEETEEIIYIYIKKKLDNFENVQTVGRKKRIIFVFTYDTTYLIEPLLKLDLGKPESKSNKLLIGFIILVIIILIIIYYKNKNRIN